MDLAFAEEDAPAEGLQTVGNGVCVEDVIAELANLKDTVSCEIMQEILPESVQARDTAGAEVDIAGFEAAKQFGLVGTVSHSIPKCLVNCVDVAGTVVGCGADRGFERVIELFFWIPFEWN